MRSLLSTALVLSIVSGSIGCMEPQNRFNQGDAGNGTDVPNANGSDVPFQFDAPNTPTDRPNPRLDPDAACATQNSSTTRAPMNLLIVLDRSGSMGECADGSGRPCANSKWVAAQQGLSRLLMRLEDEARVGLMFFPALSNGASADGYRTPHVPIAPLSMNRATLLARINGTSPNGNTPMACAMPQAVEFMRSMFNENGSRNIMLITDGVPTDECSGETCVPGFDINAFIACQMRASMAAKGAILGLVRRGANSMPPVHTYALGTPDADPTFLSTVAVNGSTQREPGCEPSNCHYSLGSATFIADLNRALDSVRDRAATCEFMLNVDPNMADPGLINVYFTPAGGGEGRFIPRDPMHMNGWDYINMGRSIQFYGPLCDEIRMPGAGASGSVRIIYGCPTIMPG